MADGPKAPETDIMHLLEQVYGGEPDALRERGLSQAITTLEATHRKAALAMRKLATQGQPSSQVTRQAGSPQAAVTRALGAGHTEAAPGPTDVSPAPAAAPAGAGAPAPAQVVSGEGAQVDMGHRTLTHIVRPRGT